MKLKGTLHIKTPRVLLQRPSSALALTPPSRRRRQLPVQPHSQTKLTNKRRPFSAPANGHLARTRYISSRCKALDMGGILSDTDLDVSIHSESDSDLDSDLGEDVLSSRPKWDSKVEVFVPGLPEKYLQKSSRKWYEESDSEFDSASKRGEFTSQTFSYFKSM